MYSVELIARDILSVSAPSYGEAFAIAKSRAPDLLAQADFDEAEFGETDGDDQEGLSGWFVALSDQEDFTYRFELHAVVNVRAKNAKQARKAARREISYHA